MDAPMDGTALITGASRGLGRALALSAPAARLILTARDAAALETVADEARAGGREVEIVTGDLSEPDGRAAVVEASDGRIDILVNNAGLGDYAPFLETEPGKIEAALQVNTVAPALLARALLPGMIARANESGRSAGLVMLSSGFAFVPTPGLAAYGASKAFVLSLTEALAAELSDQPVDVLAACPGPVKTGFAERAGFSGGAIPGAMSPDFVARRIWAALGRQSTLVLGPLDTPLFGPAALARSLAARLGWGAQALARRFDSKRTPT